jgi:hypothetical protein
VGGPNSRAGDGVRGRRSADAEVTDITARPVSVEVIGPAVRLVDTARARLEGDAVSYGAVFLEFIALRYSATALDAGAPISSTIATRSAVESAIYNFLTRVPISPGGYHIYRAKGRGDFEKLIGKIAAANVLSRDLLGAVRRIRKHGNYAAHLAEKVDARTLGRMAANLKRIKRGLKGTHRPFYLTPSERQASRDLRDAVAVVDALARKKAV